MMFLQFFVWGAWYVTVGNYMTAIGLTGVIYWAYTVSPIAAVVSPFFLGMVADRYFATEKVLGALHLLGGIAILLAPGAFGSAPLFVALLLVHVLFYMPTLGLSNSLAFHHIRDQEKEFPLIRVFGTVGWIAANVVVSAVLEADATPIPLYAAGIASLAMGLYSFTLPHTPPPAAGTKPTVRSILGLDALSRLNSRPFAVFIASSLLICIPLSAYYAYAPVFVASAGLPNPAFQMSFGQMSEVLFMVAMPFFFLRLGVKWMLVVGMAAWVLRYGLFALAAPSGNMPLILSGILLHGICYDFFFVTGQIYVDKKSSEDIRGQAQGFLVLVTYGVGMLLGAQISGWVFNAIVPDPKLLAAWQTFWWVPAGFAALVILFFGAGFDDRLPEKQEEVAPGEPERHPTV
jgi:nucleoside transporter